jgi:MscS family membrane protein
LLIVFGGLLAALSHFGVRATAALAGLGVGGIAVALAAQKTLENVIGGVSIILDQAVRAGDFLNVIDAQGTATLGTVEYVGLRSTRIRTLDRTLVSVPNGQLANVRLESMSARDKFWFHPLLSLRYQTTAEEMRSVLNGISDLLVQHPCVERNSSRVRFLKVGTSSLEVEVFAYLVARDWPHFLEMQQDLLLRMMETVEAAGAQLAIQSQTVYLASDETTQGNGMPSLPPRAKAAEKVAS